MTRLPIATPAAIVDLDALERNIARMAERARAAGVALRPHAKTHKCAAIARMQMAAGAVGVCCAKLGEAEALAAAGVPDILVTSPVASPELAARAVALAAKIRLAVVVDHPQGLAWLAEAAEGGEAALDVCVDVDVGLGRTGVQSSADAVALAKALSNRRGLRYRGVQGYGGHLQHIAGDADRREATVQAMGRLVEAVEALKAEGLAPEVITGGGTGTAQADFDMGLLTELQPGSYVFMDREYRDALGEVGDGAFETSLFVLTSVISANHPKWVTLDAGLKALATDAGPAVAAAPHEASTFAFFGDEQGLLTRADVPLNLADQVRLVAPHCDPTVDRYETLHLIRDGAVVGAVPVEARGRSA